MPTTVTNEHLRKEFDNFEKTESIGNLLEELQYSSLIVPMNKELGGFAVLKMNDESFIPLFTDIYEYQKVTFSDDLSPEIFEFNLYLELLEKGVHGFVVNVESERFPITREFLDFMKPNYMFDLDYQPFTRKEIKKIYDSIDNFRLNEFLSVESNRWDLENMMDILLGSDLLTVVVTEVNIDGLEENGVIHSYYEHGNPTRFRTIDDFAVLFSSKEKIDVVLNDHFTYSSLVNLPLFIDSVLRNDLAGIKLDEDIVLSREFLINFMKEFNTPNIDCYDGYLFRIE